MNIMFIKTSFILPFCISQHLIRVYTNCQSTFRAKVISFFNLKLLDLTGNIHLKKALFFLIEASSLSPHFKPFMTHINNSHTLSLCEFFL